MFVDVGGRRRLSEGVGAACVLNYALMDDGKIVKEIFIPLMFGIRSTLRHEKRFANIKFV